MRQTARGGRRRLEIHIPLASRRISRRVTHAGFVPSLDDDASTTATAACNISLRIDASSRYHISFSRFVGGFAMPPRGIPSGDGRRRHRGVNDAADAGAAGTAAPRRRLLRQTTPLLCLLLLLRWRLRRERRLKRYFDLFVEGVHDGGSDFIPLGGVLHLLEVEADGGENLLQCLLVNV